MVTSAHRVHRAPICMHTHHTRGGTCPRARCAAALSQTVCTRQATCCARNSPCWALFVHSGARQTPVTDGRERAVRTFLLAGCRAHALTHGQARLPAALTAPTGACTLQRCTLTARNHIIIARRKQLDACAAACSTHALHAGRMQRRRPCVLHARAEERSCRCRAAAYIRARPTCARRGGGARRTPRCRRALPADTGTGDAATAWRARMRRA
jgi:hypothetical protein